MSDESDDHNGGSESDQTTIDVQGKSSDDFIHFILEQEQVKCATLNSEEMSRRTSTVGNLESRPYSNTIVEGNEALADSTTPPPKAGGQEEGEETAAESKDDTEVEPNKAEDIQDDGEFEGFVFEAEEPDKKKKEKVELQDAPEELIDKHGMVFKRVERPQEDVTKGDSLQRQTSRRMTTTLTYQGREQKWIVMLADFEAFEAKKTKMVKRRVRKGIPLSMRGLVWPHLTGAAKAKAQAKPDHFANLVKMPADEETELQIRKDITRTFPKHVMFRNAKSHDGTAKKDGIYSTGQMSLFNVLKSVSLDNKEIGYCQGMGSPCGTFLVYLKEEDAFWMMDRLLNSEKYWFYGRMYEEGFALLFKFLSIHDYLIKKYVPKVYKLFVKLDIVSMTYATRWYNTIFSEFPRDLVLRLWDIFLYEGVKIIFRLVVALFQIFEKKILAMKEWEEVITFLSNDLHVSPELNNYNMVICTALKVGITTKQLQRLSTKYDKVKSGAQKGSQTDKLHDKLVKL